METRSLSHCVNGGRLSHTRSGYIIIGTTDFFTTYFSYGYGGSGLLECRSQHRPKTSDPHGAESQELRATGCGCWEPNSKSALRPVPRPCTLLLYSVSLAVFLTFSRCHTHLEKSVANVCSQFNIYHDLISLLLFLMLITSYLNF